MSRWLRWTLGLSLATLMVAVPFIHFRATYAHGKRLREVTAGRFYRCGQLTADGFHDAFRRYGIKTVINLQDENPDPLLPASMYRDKVKTPESEVCQKGGAKYVMLSFELPPRDKAPTQQAKTIDEFLKIADNPENLPILLHCKAGLHRTGLLTAIYRMEYEGWSKAEAMRELRANGFGDAAANTANDYVWAYIEHYTPRRLRASAAVSSDNGRDQ
jgi:protein tyrosine/serine phosphatase